MKIVDANVVLRYILDDHEELSAQAKTIIDNHTVEVPVEVLAEVVYVLTGVYHVNRQEITGGLIQFFNNTGCVLPHRNIVYKAFEFYGKSSLDFVDCILAAYNAVENAQVFTFDKPLNKLLDRLANS